MKRIYSLFFGLLLAANVYGQDPHFSMFYGVPVLLNPAFTGMFNGNFRATAQYRSQWGSVIGDEAIPSYRSILGSVELKSNKGFKKTDAFGVGIGFMHDGAGQASYSIIRGSVSGAYRLSFDKWGDHFLSAGFSVALLNNRLNYNNLSFGTQYDVVRNTYDPSRPNGETFIDNSKFMYDFSIGLLWGLNKERARIKYHGGVSMLHLNQPSLSLLNNSVDAKLPMRINIHGGASFPMGDQIDLMPKLMVMLQGKSHEEVIGADVKFLLEDRNPNGNSFIIGGLLRTVGGDSSSLNPESIAITARFGVGDFELGAAYDLNISQLKRATLYNGAFEFTLAYTTKFSRTRQRRMYCPKW